MVRMSLRTSLHSVSNVAGLRLNPPSRKSTTASQAAKCLLVGLSTVGTTLHSVVVTCPLIASMGIETVCERENRRMVYRSS